MPMTVEPQSPSLPMARPLVGVPPGAVRVDGAGAAVGVAGELMGGAFSSSRVFGLERVYLTDRLVGLSLPRGTARQFQLGMLRLRCSARRAQFWVHSSVCSARRVRSDRLDRRDERFDAIGGQHVLPLGRKAHER